MLHICERGFKGPEMVRGEMYGLSVAASMALSASGNYQVGAVYQRSVGHAFTKFFRACRASVGPKRCYRERYGSNRGTTQLN